MIKVKRFIFNPFGENTYIVFDTDTHQAILVDPGMAFKKERDELDRYIADNNLTITQIVNTHMHFDHCIGDNYVRNRYGVKVAAHTDDSFLSHGLTEQAKAFGMMPDDIDDHVDIDVPLHQGDTIDVGNYSLYVIHVPGHSPGGIALYSPDGKFVISGDSLFRHSIGRTDLPGGDTQTLLDSISSHLLTLPDDTTVLPGHDGFSSIGEEKHYNPYLR